MEQTVPLEAFVIIQLAVFGLILSVYLILSNRKVSKEEVKYIKEERDRQIEEIKQDHNMLRDDHKLLIQLFRNHEDNRMKDLLNTADIFSRLNTTITKLDSTVTHVKDLFIEIRKDIYGRVGQLEEKFNRLDDKLDDKVDKK